MRWFVTVARRTTAFAIDIALLAAISAFVLWWDERSGILYGYNAEQLGDIAIFCWFAVPELLWRTSVGKSLMRLRLRGADHREATTSQVAFRATLFWLALLAPQVFAPPAWATRWVLDTRAQVIAAVAFVFTLLVLPGATCVLSRTATGIHDFYSNTRVEPTRGDWPTARGNLPAINFSWSSRLYATASFLFVLFAASAIALDWSTNFGQALVSSYRVNKRYYETALATTERNTASFEILKAEMTTAYVAPSPNVVLLGSTQHYVLPVSRTLLADPEKAIDYARKFGTEQLRFRIPSGVRWIVVDLTSTQQFGIVARSRSLPCLINVQANFIGFPPREVSDTLHLAKSEFTARIAALIGDSLQNITVVWNRPHVETVILFTMTSWNLLSFNLLAIPDMRIPKPLGSTR